jgi:hypothetical protein
VSADGTTSLSANTWYHLVGIWDGTNVKIYVNGNLEDTTACNAMVYGTSAYNAKIGGLSANNNNNFPGIIDELRVYNTNVTSDISTLYNSGNGTETPASGGVAGWHLNESGTTATAADYIGSNTGTLSGFSYGPTFGTAKYGSASGSFDGTDDYVELGNIMPTGAYTKEAWVKRNSGSFRNNILSGTSMCPFWAPDIEGFKLTAGNVDFYAVQDSVPLAVDTWYHVAVTYDPNVSGGQMILYKNGVQVDIATSVAANTDTSLHIGAYNNANFFGGLIDEAAVYNTALSASTIAGHYGVYASSGIYESQTIDLIQKSNFSTLTFSSSTPVSTYIQFQLAANNDNSTWSYTGPDGSASTYYTATSTAISSSLNGNRYVRYKAYLSTADLQSTPTLNDVTINYSAYHASATLTSSAYNTTISTNIINSLAWTESLPSGTDVKFQLRTSSNGSTWTDWFGPTNGSDYYTNPAGTETINSAHTDRSSDQWIQYKTFLVSDGVNTPTLSDVTLTYGNARPEVQTVTASQGSNGAVAVTYEIRDRNATTGATPNVLNITLQYCTANCSSAGNETWTDATAPALTGNAGAGVPVGEDNFTSKTLYWTPVTDYPDQHNGTDFKIRIKANDGETAAALGYAESSVFTIDTIAPVLGSPAIFVQATTTPAILAMSATDNSSLEMKISLNSDLSGAVWEPYAAASSTILASDPDTVYVKFRDAYGNTTSIASAATPETPINMIIRDLSNPNASVFQEFVAWKAIATPDPGFSRYNIWHSTTGADGSYTLLATTSPNSYNYYFHSGLSATSTHYYKITSQDASGNVSYLSSAVNDTADGQGGTDTTPPTITSVDETAITTQSAAITWNTDELANSTVGYSATAGVFTTETGVATMADNAGGVGAHSVTLTGLLPFTTYYYRVISEDPTGNQTVKSDNYSFTTLSGPAISNVSNPDIKNTEATITWTTNIAANSHVYYSTSASLAGATHISQDESTNVSDHSVTLTGLTSGTKYYFYVQSGVATDNNGGDYYSFNTTVDSTAPIITFNSATDITGITDSAATVSWTTNELATSTLEYGLDTTYASGTLANDNFNTNHSFDLTGLTLGLTYYLRLKSTDANGNLRTSAGHIFETTDSTDIADPTISAVTASPVYDTVAVIKWTTNEVSDSMVEYGAVSGTYTASSTAATLTTSHAVTLTGLTASANYYYRVTSADGNSNSTTSPQSTFTTMETLSTETQVRQRETTAQAAGEVTGRSSVSGGGVFVSGSTDKTAPIISNIQTVNIKSGQATVTWKTNEAGDSIIEYGPSTTYNEMAGKRNESVVSHSVNLKNLNPATVYQFKVLSGDSSGNLAMSQNQTFTTLSPLEESAGAGAGAGQGSTAAGEEEETGSKESILTDTAKKAMDIIGQYASQVSVSVLESTLFSQYSALEKLASSIPTPIFSSGPRVAAGPTTATITWSTNKEANSLVAFAPDEIYSISANQDDPYIQLIGNPEAQIEDHSVSLYDLKPDTLYHYQLRGKSSLGPTGKSVDYTFRTAEEALEIISHAVENISNEKAAFKWVTNDETDSQIKYIPYRNNMLAVDEAKTGYDKTMTTIHELFLDDLESGVVYQVELSGKDVKGALVSREIPTFSTSSDDLPPLIYQVQAESAISPGKETKIQTIISWLTNEPSTSRVYYQQGFVSSVEELSEKTSLDANYTKKHIAVITKFDPGSIYTFRVESTDSGGNTSISKTYTILAPRQKETVFQIIMKNLEQTFGWVGGVGL